MVFPARKKNKNMLSMFLSSYRNTSESLGELGKAVETLGYMARIPTKCLAGSLKLPLVIL